MGKARRKTPAKHSARGLGADGLAFWVALAILVAVPLAFSNLVYTRYSFPKFVVLLVGSSVLALLLALNRTSVRVANTGFLRSRLVRIAYLYLVIVTVSTIFGVEPLASLFGSHLSYMGLITRLCFLLVFVALVAGIGASERRLRAMLWGVTATGFLVAGYGVAQSFGIEPFVSQNLYTFASREGPLVRVSSTLGHSNYLGNFLLYTTPISMAFAFAARGWPRLFASAAAALSVAAIVFCGTRGAWMGIAVGAVTFAVFELKGDDVRNIVRGRRTAIAAAIGLVVLLVSLVFISPASRTVRERMRALVSEGASSSGRTLLWRDSLRMVPAFPFVGCGPEGFRTAFLAFKSKELARLSPKANNESPHNAYLEAAISHGLVGAVLYIAMIVLALMLLIRTRSRVLNRGQKVIITGLLSSFAAVLVHNIFIFDQIATGLYFFAFIALAQAASNVAMKNLPSPKTDKSAPVAPNQSAEPWTLPSRALVAGASLLIVGALWYSVGLVRSEIAYRELFDPAKPVDFEKLVALGGRITSSPLPTGSYDFAFARAVDTFIRKLPGAPNSSGVDLNAVRNGATKLAIEHVEKSLAHTLTPDLNYSLLASLALADGDVDKLRYAASEAVRWDPNNYQTRWLMAEAYLVRGDRDQATREGEIALDLYHASRNAVSVLARATGENDDDDSAMAERMTRFRAGKRWIQRSTKALIESARGFAQLNRLKKAQKMLQAAIFRTDGPCPECHQELAIVYERMGRTSEAIAEWEIFIEQTPDRAAAEQSKARVEALRQKKPVQ